MQVKSPTLTNRGWGTRKIKGDGPGADASLIPHIFTDLKVRASNDWSALIAKPSSAATVASEMASPAVRSQVRVKWISTRWLPAGSGMSIRLWLAAHRNALPGHPLPPATPDRLAGASASCIGVALCVSMISRSAVHPSTWICAPVTGTIAPDCGSSMAICGAGSAEASSGRELSSGFPGSSVTVGANGHVLVGAFVTLAGGDGSARLGGVSLSHQAVRIIAVAVPAVAARTSAGISHARRLRRASNRCGDE